MSKKILLTTLLISAMMITGCGSSDAKENTEVVNTSVETEESVETDKSNEVEETTSIVEDVVSNMIYDGIYKVGTDIEPGLYKVTITDEIMNMAYVDRSSSASMDMDSIIANIIYMNSGYVRVKETDAYVKVQGGALSGEETIIKDIKSEVGEGTFLVGIDIEPGTYKLEVTDTLMNMAYIARLSDVSMDIGDIIVNDIFDGPGYVEVKESDFAITVQGAKLTKSE